MEGIENVAPFYDFREFYWANYRWTASTVVYSGKDR
jgi:hypothetical protein